MTLLLIYSCNKDDDYPKEELPPITSEGANTFGCLVDGEVWLPEKDVFFELISTSEKLEVSYNKDKKRLRIYSKKDKCVNDIQTVDQRFSLTFLLDEKPTYDPDDCDRIFKDYLKNTYYDLDSLYHHEIDIIRHDTIISGTFNFRAIDHGNADTVYITDGRFDVKY